MTEQQTTKIEDYQFFIDIVSPELISGWAFYQGGDHKAHIEVRSGETTLWSTMADNVREDLQQAGFGDCAFSITPNIKVLVGNIESVDIYIDGHKINEAPFPLVMQALNLDAYTCHIDINEGDKVNGWARYNDNDTHRVEVSLQVGDAVLGRVIADNMRQDLADANIGDGQYGFQMSLDLAMFPAATVNADVYVDGKLSQLPAVELSVAQEAVDRAKFLTEFADQIGSFEQLVEKESQRLAEQINSNTAEDQQVSLNTVTNVAIQNIAELSARLHVLEHVVSKKL
ncbi:hypothetical protein [Shewanella sp. 6_MG-2023]|uniref:hypothetical protein n=1 Tax=Shewanella sp. 6_MG-2023 TaxID=3062660 RepID=UPI0026E3C66F|nr:hypothetical protein [Shewanella sp. 6_MG-2023]MDO6617626.1 hypothetical protein [Shewanella sp. 6_MG-2023]